MKQTKTQVDNLFLHVGETRVDLWVDCIFVKEHRVCVMGDLYNIVAGVVEESGDFPGTPVDIPLAGLGETVFQLIPIGAGFRKGPVHISSPDLR